MNRLEAPALDLRSAMVDRPGAVLRLVYRRFFRAIRFDEEAAARVRSAVARGPVVYVLQTVSYLEFLYFNYVLRREGLPLARFANGGVRTVLLWPLHIAMRILFGLWRLARGARLEGEEDALVRCLHGGDAALLFLRPSRSVVVDASTVAQVRGRFMEALLAAYRRHGTRVQLVPMALLWGKPTVRPERRGAIDFLFGDPEAPGRLRAFWMFLRHHRSSVVKVGEPIDLAAFVASPDLAGRSDDGLARALRFELSGRIERERRAMQGPPGKHAGRLRAEVMRSRALNAVIERVAEAKGRPPKEVARQAEKLLVEIAARPHPWAFLFLKRLLAFVFDRIYDGIDVDEAGMARLREASKQGPLVLLPSHKSHVDYLILSYVFYLHDLPCPYVAAGANLSFFPLGFLFRRAGAFFIRRSFRGDALYAAVLSAYLKRLLRDGYPIEFFIEGGRSRTGKLLAPRLGLLGMVTEAGLSGEAGRASLVPIAINYEKVVEEGSYARESLGGEKKKETFGALLRARRVLKSQYGRIDLQIGEPIPLAAALAEVGAVAGPDEAALKQAILRLGHRVRWSIAQATAVTPSALVASAALAGGGRALPRRELDRNLAWLVARAKAAGARFAAALEGDLEGGVQRAIDLLEADEDLELRGIGGETLVVIPEERRTRLEFYKNHGVHAFSDASIAARAALAAARGGDEAELAEIRSRALGASRLLKLELVYRPGLGFDKGFTQSLDDLVAAGWLDPRGSRLLVTAQGKTALPVLAGLTASYLEAYRLLAKTALAYPRLTGKDLIARTLSEGEKAVLLGEVTRREALSRPYFETALDYLRGRDAFDDRSRLIGVLDEVQSVR